MQIRPSFVYAETYRKAFSRLRFLLSTRKETSRGTVLATLMPSGGRTSGSCTLSLLRKIKKKKKGNHMPIFLNIFSYNMMSFVVKS